MATIPTHRNRTSRIFTFTILSLVAIAACKHHPELDSTIDDGTVNPPDTIVIINPHPCDPDSVYFVNTIQPLLNSSCAVEECHDAITHEDGVRLYDYEHIIEEVTPGNLGNSNIWEAINASGDDQMPPADYPQLSADQINMIRDWILQGALNNSCQEDCNPEDFSFATNIFPIVDLTCNGCHGGNNPSANLSLETYDQVRAIALDGSLMGSLHGIAPYSLMPDNTTGLPDCYIQQFQNWVDAGAPNN